MSNERLRAFLVFHGFMGCDTVSLFPGKGKKTAFQVGTGTPEITSVLARYMSSPNELGKTKLTAYEKFVVLLYERTCSEVNVDAAKCFCSHERGDK